MSFEAFLVVMTLYAPITSTTPPVMTLEQQPYVLWEECQEKARAVNKQHNHDTYWISGKCYLNVFQ